MHGLADQDRGSVDLVHPLQAGGEIDRVAHAGVLQPRLRPDAADDGGTAMDADAGLEGGKTLGPLPLVEAAMAVFMASAQAAGMADMFRVAIGRVPDRIDRIAQELDQRALVGEHDVVDHVEIGRQHRDDLLRRAQLADGGEILDVGEHRGDIVALGAAAGGLAAGDEGAHDLDRHIEAEGVDRRFGRGHRLAEGGDLGDARAHPDRGGGQNEIADVVGFPGQPAQRDGDAAGRRPGPPVCRGRG